MSIIETLESHPWTNINNGYQKCKPLSNGVRRRSVNNNNDSDEELSQFVRIVAQQELREDDATRENALEAFRLWISQNKDVKNVDTGRYHFFYRLNKILHVALEIHCDDV